MPLKPCPFCGGKARYVDLGDPGEFEDWNIECEGCGIIVTAPGQEEGCVTTQGEAMIAWNRRSEERMLVLNFGGI